MNKKHVYGAIPTSKDILQERQRLMPTRDLLEYCREYAHERPEVVAFWCFGIGFALGWRLKHW